MGGLVVKIENKDHLSPAEAETGAELGNMKVKGQDRVPL